MEFKALTHIAEISTEATHISEASEILKIKILLASSACTSLKASMTVFVVYFPGVLFAQNFICFPYFFKFILSFFFVIRISIWMPF